MEFVLNLPAYIKVFSGFSLILILAALRLPLGYATLIATAVLFAISGISLAGLKILAFDFCAPESSLLMVIVFMLMIFSEALRKSGRMELAVAALRRQIKNPKLLLGGLPALVGLLPMPGGALFSAPLVDAVDNEKTIAPLDKVAINYWFRHLWEYWWPLYPGVVLAIKYSTLPAGIFFAVQIPLTIASFAAGTFFIMLRIKNIPTTRTVPAATGQSTTAVTAIFAALWPILLLIVISLAGTAVLPQVGINANLANLVSMLGALIVASLLIFVLQPHCIKPSFKRAVDRETWMLLLIVGGIQLFSLVLQLPLGDNVTLVMLMRNEFMALGVPIWGIILIVPFVSGLVTGVAFGFVGISFPLVFALLGAHPSINELAATTVLAYGFGYIGMTISPIHVCFVVTASYFKCNLYKTFALLWKPVAAMAVATAILGVGYYFIY